MIYETSSDRKNQQDIADKLAALWSCSVIKMPHLHPVDFLIGDDVGAAWMEVKRRKAKSTTYVSLIIDKKKIDAGLKHSTATGFPFIIVVHWEDGIFYATARNDYATAVGGRFDRGDPNDRELVCHIPVSHFTRLQ